MVSARVPSRVVLELQEHEVNVSALVRELLEAYLEGLEGKRDPVLVLAQRVQQMEADLRDSRAALTAARTRAHQASLERHPALKDLVAVVANAQRVGSDGGPTELQRYHARRAAPLLNVPPDRVLKVCRAVVDQEGQPEDLARAALAQLVTPVPGPKSAS